jgi:DNA-binding beta-propeller fold protein YncE
VDLILDSSIGNIPLGAATTPACGNPQGVVAGIPGTASASANRLYVACTGPAGGVIAVIDTTSDTVVTVVSVGTAGGTLEGIAITGNGATVFATDSTNDELVAIDTATNTQSAGSPFDPGPGDLSSPLGLAIHPVNGNIYIASSGDDSVVIVNTSAPGTTVAKHTTGSSVPSQVAITPDAAGTRVFVTFFGTNAFGVFTAATPLVAPTVITPAGGDALNEPLGITIPPLVAGPFQVFIANSGTTVVTNQDEIKVRDDTPATFPANATTPTITLGSPAAPRGLAHTPVPR